MADDAARIRAKPNVSPEDGDDQSALGTVMTGAAFGLTLAVVIARAMLSETLREPFDVTPGGFEAPRGPGPTTTLVFDALCCLPALLVLARRAFDEEYRVRWGWSHLAAALLAGWAAVSALWSSDRFTTIVAAANFIAAAALIWSTAQLVRSWRRLRIVAGVSLGLLMVYAAHGLIYHYIQVPDNIRFWEENKDRILQDRGLEPGSYPARQFERKFVGGEMIGFNQSPNSYAAVIVLLMVVSTGVAIQRYASGDPPGWWVAIALACVPALGVILLTHSRTALGTLLIATAALTCLGFPRTREWLGRHSRLAYGIGAAAVVLGAAALIGHGIYHGSLPNDSLNFRWRYWVAAAELVKESPLNGVGWGNFGPHYLAVRVPAAAEEIRDPHNFIVRAFAELGIFGGLLVIAWLARIAWEMTRPTVPAGNAAAPLASAWTTIGSIAIAGLAINMIAGIDWSQPSAFLILEGFYRALYLGLILAGIALAALRARASRDLDDRPAQWVLYGVVVAIAVFLVHAMMDFVLAEPGAMTLFAVVLGTGLGVRMPSPPARPRRGVAITALSLGAVAWIAAVLMVVIPVADAEETANRADDAIRSGRADAAGALFEQSFHTIPWNAQYAARSARAFMLAGAAPEKVRAMLDLAIATDPANAQYLQTRAAYEMQQPAPDPAAVKADYTRIVKLDPNNLSARIEFAETLLKLDDRPAAVAEYREALRLNELLDPTEPERLPPQRVKEIEDLIAQSPQPGA